MKAIFTFGTRAKNCMVATYNFGSVYMKNIYSLRKLQNNEKKPMISYAIFINSGMFHKFLLPSRTCSK